MEDGQHRYDAPEPEDETRAKAVGYAVLGALVVFLLVMVATGNVTVFDY